MKSKTVTRRACVALAAVIMTVALSFVPEVVQPVAAGGGQSNLECGTTATGRITDGNYNYYDYWYFSGKADDKVTITMTRTSGDLNSMVRLYFSTPSGSDFELLATAEAAGGSSSAVITSFTLPATGTYSINTRRSDGAKGTTGGDYNVTFACSAGASSVTASDSCPERGGTIFWEGIIGADNYNSVDTQDGDFWTFEAESGDRVRLELTTSAFKPFLGLYWYESGWNNVAFGILLPYPTPVPGTTQYIPPTYAINRRLNQSGCYYVWIAASADSQAKTGKYFLEFSLK